MRKDLRPVRTVNRRRRADRYQIPLDDGNFAALMMASTQIAGKHRSCASICRLGFLAVTCTRECNHAKALHKHSSRILLILIPPRKPCRRHYPSRFAASKPPQPSVFDAVHVGPLGNWFLHVASDHRRLRVCAVERRVSSGESPPGSASRKLRGNCE